MSSRYIPEIIYTLALTSLSTHMLFLRKEAEDQRAHYATRIKLLEDTARRLRAGEAVPQSDFDLIQKLAREPGSDHGAARGIEPTDHIDWKQVLLGRKEDDSSRSEHWETKDLEELQKAARQTS